MRPDAREVLWGRKDAVLPARGQASGPRDSASRRSSGNNSPYSLPPDCHVRPVAHPPSGFAAGRQGRRFDEPQKHSQFVFGRSQRRTNIKAEAASKRRCASPPHPGAAGRPLTRGLSYSLSAQSMTNKFSPTHRPQSKPHARPARLENRNRFSSLKNNRSPKLAPVLRPVSASLRLRCRSAGAARHAKTGRVYS